MTTKHWRENAEDATQQIARIQHDARIALRAHNVSLATALAVARRHGDLLDTANLTGTPYVLAERLAAWADLTVISTTRPTPPRPNAAYARADAQAQSLHSPTDLPEMPGAVVTMRVHYYAHLRAIDLPTIIDRLGPLGEDPSFSRIQAYADALGVPLVALVMGAVDDEPMPV